MSKEINEQIKQGYVLTEEKAKIITEFFDAIDIMKIVDYKEKQKVFDLLDNVLFLLSDNEIINGWKIENAKKLINQTDFKETDCVIFYNNQEGEM